MYIPFAALISLAAVLASPLELEKRQQPPPETVFINPVMAPKTAVSFGYDSLTQTSNGLTLFLSEGARYVSGYWLLPDGNEGQIRVQSFTRPPKCIDAGSCPKSGVELKIWDCYDVPQQKWKITGDRIELAGYNLCFDIKDGNYTNNRGVVQTWECAQGNPNQKFFFKKVSGPVSS